MDLKAKVPAGYRACCIRDSIDRYLSEVMQETMSKKEIRREMSVIPLNVTLG